MPRVLLGAVIYYYVMYKAKAHRIVFFSLSLMALDIDAKKPGKDECLERIKYLKCPRKSKFLIRQSLRKGA